MIVGPYVPGFVLDLFGYRMKKKTDMTISHRVLTLLR